MGGQGLGYSFKTMCLSTRAAVAPKPTCCKPRGRPTEEACGRGVECSKEKSVEENEVSKERTEKECILRFLVLGHVIEGRFLVILSDVNAPSEVHSRDCFQVMKSALSQESN